MKMTKRIFSLICIMSMIISLCGCGNQAQKLYGTWSTSIDVSTALEQQLGADFEGFHMSFELTMLVDFNEDGTYKIYVDEDKTRESLNAYCSEVINFAIDSFYEKMSELGLGKAQADEAVMRMYNKDITDYISEAITGNIDISEIISSASVTGVYKVKKDKLYMDPAEIKSNVYGLFKVEEGILTINAPSDEAAESANLIEGMNYPFVFTKVIENN